MFGSHLKEVDKLQSGVYQGAKTKSNSSKPDLLVVNTLFLPPAPVTNLSIIEPWLFSLSEVISFTSISPCSQY